MRYLTGERGPELVIPAGAVAVAQQRAQADVQPGTQAQTRLAALQRPAGPSLAPRPALGVSLGSPASTPQRGGDVSVSVPVTVNASFTFPGGPAAASDDRVKATQFGRTAASELEAQMIELLRRGQFGRILQEMLRRS